ncbi:MAG: signal peptide peptidase SppA, partial [Bacteroidales bacterium]|nr:signal peptide peptidase SppA [Bacteroidales bacterium]
KAIVLRVNSPGGSALASDIIWNEIELAKQAGKKIVVSMGDYTASGGYYISCGADLIVSQPNTLTGSIGVFGLVPNIQKFLKNKLGVTVDVVNTNKHADYMTGFRALDPTEAKIIQIEVDEIYKTFVSRVATGRNMAAEEVDKIGEGRVWSGKDALEIGLVDQLGTLNDAIVEAAKLANLDNYGIEYFPTPKEWWMTFLNQDKNTDAVIKAKLGELYFINDAYQQIMNSKGTQARMPFEIMFE